MEIMNKINAIAKDMHGAEMPVIAFLGDSVTQGCFECYLKEGRAIETVFDSQHAVSAYVGQILHKLYPNANINIINAGISGDNVIHGAKRLDKHVLRFHPDLAVVGYGLNDCFWKPEDFQSGIREIFGRLKDAGCEVIFLTPNLMNAYVDPEIHAPELAAVAADAMTKAEALDATVAEAKKAAEEYGVTVCDVYAKWKRMAELGVDVTRLLANRINHPDRDMNWMTAFAVVETMMK